MTATLHLLPPEAILFRTFSASLLLADFFNYRIARSFSMDTTIAFP
jgi:hypothetical protein